jgi:hypothetical protein
MSAAKKCTVTIDLASLGANFGATFDTMIYIVAMTYV